MNAASLLQRAGEAVVACLPFVDVGAKVSHVGFRSKTKAEWQGLLELLAPLGEVCMTYKPDGREIPFVRLLEPVDVAGQVLRYVELPASKAVWEDQPEVVVVFVHAGEARNVVAQGYDIRQQNAGAAEFIARDKMRMAS